MCSQHGGPTFEDRTSQDLTAAAALAAASVEAARAAKKAAVKPRRVFSFGRQKKEAPPEALQQSGTAAAPSLAAAAAPTSGFSEYDALMKRIHDTQVDAEALAQRCASASSDTLHCSLVQAERRRTLARVATLQHRLREEVLTGESCAGR